MRIVNGDLVGWHATADQPRKLTSRESSPPSEGGELSVSPHGTPLDRKVSRETYRLTSTTSSHVSRRDRFVGRGAELDGIDGCGFCFSDPPDPFSINCRVRTAVTVVVGRSRNVVRQTELECRETFRRA